MALLADKVVGAEHVALCPTMDLVAIVTRDGALIVHRTMTWQKLLTVPTAEMSEMGGGPTAICWAPSKKGPFEKTCSTASPWACSRCPAPPPVPSPATHAILTQLKAGVAGFSLIVPCL